MDNFRKEENNLVVKVGTHQCSIPCFLPNYGNDDIDDANMAVEYFYSPYYDAASNYFGIKLKFLNDKYWGMIYPAILLDGSNKELYSDMKGYQHHMLTLGLIDILDNYLKVLKTDDDYVELNFEDLPLVNHLFLLVFDKAIYDNINTVLPSLSLNGFMTTNKLFDRDDKVSDLYYSEAIAAIADNIKKDNKDIKLSRISETMQGFQFLPILYKEILPLKIPYAYRYIVIYQIIEYLIDKKRNEILIQNLTHFDIKSRGDLRETIQATFKEEALIKRVYADINTTHDYYLDFVERAKILFKKLGKEYTNNDEYCDFMYGVRNVIVHNYKEASFYSNTIKDLAELLEFTTADLMCKIEIEDCDDKQLFVINKKETYKENKRRFYSAYHI